MLEVGKNIRTVAERMLNANTLKDFVKNGVKKQFVTQKYKIKAEIC